MQRLLILLGLSIAAIGMLWPWLGKLPFGRLPGDIMIDRPGLKFFAPFTTMIVLSLVLSLVLWLFRRKCRSGSFAPPLRALRLLRSRPYAAAVSTIEGR